MRIVDLDPSDARVLEELAGLLVSGFAEIAPEAWPDLASAREEVAEALDAERINRVALGDDGAVLGWIGGMPEYQGHVWEMHPLVVATAHQGQGIGRALVQDFEARVAERGGLTILLGTDDETDRTTLSNVDLYADLPGRLASARALRPHPFTFYQRLGYTIVGVVPDANGPGKPDILMAKAISRSLLLVEQYARGYREQPVSAEEDEIMQAAVREGFASAAADEQVIDRDAAG